MAARCRCSESACDITSCWCLQEVKLVLPNAQRINRGGKVLSELVESCRNNDFTDIIILHEHRGEPGKSSTVRST